MKRSSLRSESYQLVILVGNGKKEWDPDHRSGAEGLGYFVLLSLLLHV